MRSSSTQSVEVVNRRLSWAISITLLFLTIGVVGAKRPALVQRNLAALESPVEEPLEIKAQEITAAVEDTAPAAADNPEPWTPTMPDLPSAPEGTGPIQLAKGPALLPPDALTTLQPAGGSGTETNVGSMTLPMPGNSAGHYPPPVYPDRFQSRGIQGTVIIKITVDATGNKQSVEVKASSGNPELDEYSRRWVQRHWMDFPPTDGPRSYHAPLTFKLEAGRGR